MFFAQKNVTLHPWNIVQAENNEVYFDCWGADSVIKTSRKPKTIESSLFVAADVHDKNTFDYDTNLWER